MRGPPLSRRPPWNLTFESNSITLLDGLEPELVEHEQRVGTKPPPLARVTVAANRPPPAQSEDREDMATIVFFHAHPDDEAIATGGTMAKAAGRGHRVVLVTATNGEHGEQAPGLLAEGETLAERRVAELRAAADVLGVGAIELLGYTDSGMMGAPTNEAPGSFWTVEVEEAARRVAAVLESEGAEVLVVYDEDGTYGHPDHIQVHRVGVRAADLAGTPRVYENVIGRDELRRNLEEAREAGIELPSDIDFSAMGVPDDTVTTRVDVSAFLDLKRAAMAAHASQIPPSSMFLSLPEDLFARGFGTEEYRLVGAAPGTTQESLLDGV
jgi:LmbE family N-acetylglucosaminyl deacetylase